MGLRAPPFPCEGVRGHWPQMGPLYLESLQAHCVSVEVCKRERRASHVVSVVMITEAGLPVGLTTRQPPPPVAGRSAASPREPCALSCHRAPCGCIDGGCHLGGGGCTKHSLRRVSPWREPFLTHRVVPPCSGESDDGHSPHQIHQAPVLCMTTGQPPSGVRAKEELGRASRFSGKWT